MNFEITGKLIQKGETQQIKESFRKREFVLDITETNSMYPNYAKLQLTQTKCELLDAYDEGDSIKVTFNIRGNRWEKDGKINYITGLDAWKLDLVAKSVSESPVQNMQAETKFSYQTVHIPPNQQHAGGFPTPPPAVDDLPF